MTVVRLRGLRDGIPAPALAAITATVQRWAGRSPAPIFDGADVILPAEVAIDVNAQTITLPATDGRFCIRWVITGADLAPVIRYTAIPATAAVDFADLLDVDPNTFKPNGTTSAWLAAVADVRDHTETAVSSAAASGRSAFNAGESAAVALGHARSAEDGAIAAAQSSDTAATHARDADTARAAAVEARTDAGVAADDAEAARDDARAARTDAQAARTDAQTARTDARTAQTGAQTARTGAETAQTGAQTARAAAEAAQNVALAGQFAGSNVPSGTDLNTLSTPGVFRITWGATIAQGAPYEGFVGTFMVLSRAGNAVTQLAFKHNALGSDSRRIYARTQTGTWGAWSVFASQRIDETAGRAVYTFDPINGRDQLIYGDTGVRDVTAIVAAIVPVTQGVVRLARKGAVVTLSFDNWIYQGQTAANSADLKAFLPAGFRPSFVARYPIVSARNAVGQATVYGDGRITVEPAAAYGQYATITFVTQDAWPSSLPGTAVGSVPNA